MRIQNSPHKVIDETVDEAWASEWVDYQHLWVGRVQIAVDGDLDGTLLIEGTLDPEGGVFTTLETVTLSGVDSNTDFDFDGQDVGHYFIRIRVSVANSGSSVINAWFGGKGV